eukprot:TRINITY_DN894_c0_g1_i1.p1 TRINITY_DN894_c0_g1~~TRINITY_DN894_c0_g1_i1.p1  ORF type:complete len:139 (+),score=33.01 TRINITY_DN894_c0_g1_i1:248-664(+)
MHKHRGVAGIRNSALAALAVRRLKNAHRRIEYANGDVYEGQFGGDIYKAHGQGEFLFASGGKYTGGFVGGKFDGAGTCQYADGSQYEGEWAMGAQQGGGTFRYVSGNVYTCLLYTSDAADEEDSVDLGGRRIIKKKKK